MIIKRLYYIVSQFYAFYFCIFQRNVARFIFFRNISNKDYGNIKFLYELLSVTP